MQMANKHMKTCSTLLIIREMQIKTTMRYHLTVVRMVIIQKCTNSKGWRECWENENLLHGWWECKLIQPQWRIVWRILKKTKQNKTTTVWPSNPTTGHITWGKHNWKWHICPSFHCSTIYNSKDIKQARCSTRNEWIRKLYIHTWSITQV